MGDYLYKYKTWTHTHAQPFYGSMDLVRDNPGEPVPEKTFNHSHLSWSAIIPYLLHPSNKIHGILPVQSFTSNHNVILPIIGKR